MGRKESNQTITTNRDKSYHVGKISGRKYFFKAIRENKILAKISGFTVSACYQQIMFLFEILKDILVSFNI